MGGKLKRSMTKQMKITIFIGSIIALIGLGILIASVVY